MRFMQPPSVSTSLHQGSRMEENDMITKSFLFELKNLSKSCFMLSGAIIRARFTEERALALISDSGGSVFELSLKKTLGLRSYASRCIFSGRHQKPQKMDCSRPQYVPDLSIANCHHCFGILQGYEHLFLISFVIFLLLIIIWVLY